MRLQAGRPSSYIDDCANGVRQSMILLRYRLKGQDQASRRNLAYQRCCVTLRTRNKGFLDKMIWRATSIVLIMCAGLVYTLIFLDVIQRPSFLHEFLGDSVVFESRTRIDGIQTFEFDGKTPIKVKHGDIQVTVRRSSLRNHDDVFPIASGYERGRLIFEMPLDEQSNPTPIAELLIVRLDPDNPRPNIVFKSFWAGAHCCTMTKIASFSNKQWIVVKGETLDGGGYSLVDVDNDGIFEMVSVDNSFHYRFDSYAGSVAPIRVSTLSGEKIIDVTRRSTVRAYVRDNLLSIEKFASADNAIWKSNGFLAGWVASKAQVGEFDDAWARMLKLYDRGSDWGLGRCRVAMVDYRCPAGQEYQLTFPEALRAHLVEHGYLKNASAN